MSWDQSVPSIVSAMNRAEPSQKTVFTPPGCPLNGYSVGVSDPRR
jgi:hypothetical protein